MRIVPLLPWLLLLACDPADSDAPKPDDSGPEADADTDADADGDADADADADADSDADTDTVPAECPWTEAEQPSDRALSTDVSGRIETTTRDGYTDTYLYDEADYIKVGVRQDWGGSIVFFGLHDGAAGLNDSNTIDANDTGREVQIALYDPDRIMQGCAWDASCQTTPTTCPASITYLGWNPVQGGNRCNNGSGVNATGAASDGALEVRATPLHWNPNWEDRDCDSGGCSDSTLAWLRGEIDLVQTLRFARTHVVELRYAVTETAGMDHAATNQEMPTLYSANGNGGPDLWRLMLPDGSQVDIDTPGNDGFYYENLTSTEPWVTLQNDGADYGVGILYENGVTAFQGWQNRSLPFNNVRALFPFGIPAHGTVNARAYLLIGSYGTVASEASAVMAALAPFGVLDSPSDDSTVPGTTSVRGWALDNRGVSDVWARIDERVEVGLSYGSSRPDVCAAWPGYPACDTVGFEGELDLGALEDGSGCPHLVEILARDSDGNERVIDRALVGVQG
jgi:hypothetical protein